MFQQPDWPVDINGTARFDYGITNSSSWSMGGNLFMEGNLIQQVSALKFYNGGDTGLITSPTVGVINLGGGAGASPQGQTLQAQSGAGTNIAGQNWILIGSLSTGTATDGDIYFQTGVKNGGSGSTPATATTALILRGETQQAVFAGPIQISSLQSGTPATYACFDLSHNLISSNTAC